MAVSNIWVAPRYEAVGVKITEPLSPRSRLWGRATEAVQSGVFWNLRWSAMFSRRPVSGLKVTKSLNCASR